MANGDAGVPTDIGSGSTERNLSADLIQAQDVGRMTLGIAEERSVKPKFGVRRYSMPMLDPGYYSRNEVTAVFSNPSEISDDNIKVAKEASIALVLESSVQIMMARARSSQVTEDVGSLKGISTMLDRGRGYMIQTEASDPQIMIDAGRKALAHFKQIKGLDESEKWDDQKVLAWEKSTLGQASSRVSRITENSQAYLNTRF